MFLNLAFQLKAMMAKKIRNAPGWLGLAEDRTSFIYVPERAQIVREIFQMSVAGMGGYSIAKLLNSKNVPAFGTSKRWDQSTIHNMLSSRATIGEYQRKTTIDGKECPVGEPVPGYYPSVIEESVFQAAQEARQRNLVANRGRKGQFITNLFAGLPKCSYCGSPVKFHSNGSAKSLICKTVLEHGECPRFGWIYKDFENSFFELFGQNKDFPEFAEQLLRLRASTQAQLPNEIYHARSEIARTVKAAVLDLTIMSAGLPPPSVQREGPIRRSHPSRHFLVLFAKGTARIGYPIHSVDRPNRIFDPLALSKSLGISPRQGALVALLAGGDRLASVAEKLGVTLETARWHLREIFKKTGTHSQTELLNLAEPTSSFEDDLLKT